MAVPAAGFNIDPQLPENSKVSPVLPHHCLKASALSGRAGNPERWCLSLERREPVAKQPFLNAMSDLIGVDKSSLDLITTAQSTRDEAAAAKALSPSAPIVLATTAGHMPRAMQILT